MIQSQSDPNSLVRIEKLEQLKHTSRHSQDKSYRNIQHTLTSIDQTINDRSPSEIPHKRGNEYNRHAYSEDDTLSMTRPSMRAKRQESEEYQLKRSAAQNSKRWRAPNNKIAVPPESQNSTFISSVRSGPKEEPLLVAPSRNTPNNGIDYVPTTARKSPDPNNLIDFDSHQVDNVKMHRITLNLNTQ